MEINKELNFNKFVPFCFFLSSYSPLFLILICRNIKNNKEYLNFGGFSKDSIYCFFTKFGFSIGLMLLTIIGFIGTYLTIKNLRKDYENGEIVTIQTCKNNTSDFLTYFASYLFPLFFQTLIDWTDVLAIIIFVFFIFILYIKSSIMLVNPILSIFNYRIYEISFITENNTNQTGSILTKDILEENKLVKIYPFGNQIYFGGKS